MEQHFNAIERIKDLCDERGYSYYELAKRSNITYSTLNTMILKQNSPSLSTLCKLCDGFGITLSQFFNINDSTIDMSDEQKECFDTFNILSPEKQKLALAYMKGLAQKI